MYDNTTYWGLLGPEQVFSQRRTRTLNINAAVRYFNELAVPGMGNVWYAKQLLWPLLGIGIAKRLQASGYAISNIQMANAIEALGCWLALASGEVNTDARVLGKVKLAGKKDLSFKVVSQKNFYVTQPMRMATVTVLPALQLVMAESNRFNAYELTRSGEDFMQRICAEYPPCYYKQNVVEFLSGWAIGKSKIELNNEKLINILSRALSPMTPLPDGAKTILLERIVETAESQRRKAIWTWCTELQVQQQVQQHWDNKPHFIDDEHWDDLRAGALFFAVRGQAIEVLNVLEAHMRQHDERFPLHVNDIPSVLTNQVDRLKEKANHYLKLQHEHVVAKRFCEECTLDQAAAVLEKLVERDGQVLRLVGQTVQPGPAFGTGHVGRNEDENTADESIQNASTLGFPEGISYRVRNLYWMTLDLQGELDEWLTRDNRGADNE